MTESSANQSFKLPREYPIPQGNGGRMILTSPVASVYLLTWESAPDNRLTPSFLHTLIRALEDVSKNVPHSSVLVTTSAIPKFYSNGFNLELAMSTPGFWRETWNKLQLTLLTFPMPLVALINGHAVS